MPDSPDDLELSAFLVKVPLKFRRLYLFLVEVVPVYSFKPGIILERHKGRPSEAAFGLILVKQLVHQLACLLVLERTGVLEL